MFTSGFFNSINSDRKYNAEQMAAIFDGLITDGIFDSIGDHFQVTPASSGLGVNIGTGRAWLNQTWSYNDTAYPVTLGAASPSLGRKDLICLKVDKSSAVRSNSLVVIAGTPAASPVEPTVTDDTTNGIYYHKLAAVTVQAGATSISAADIANYIGLSTGTPYVTGLLSSTTVDELWSQWDGEFNDWWDDIKATLDDNIVTTILNKIDHITPKEATMNLYGFSHIDPPPSGMEYKEYSTDAILNQISSLLNGTLDKNLNVFGTVQNGYVKREWTGAVSKTSEKTLSFTNSSSVTRYLWYSETIEEHDGLITFVNPKQRSFTSTANNITNSLNSYARGKYFTFDLGSTYTDVMTVWYAPSSTNFTYTVDGSVYINSSTELTYMEYSKRRNLGNAISKIEASYEQNGSLGYIARAGSIGIATVGWVGTNESWPTSTSDPGFYTKVTFPYRPIAISIPRIDTLASRQQEFPFFVLPPNPIVFDPNEDTEVIWPIKFEYYRTYVSTQEDSSLLCALDSDGKSIWMARETNGNYAVDKNETYLNVIGKHYYCTAIVAI